MTNSVSCRLEGMKPIVVSNNGNTHDLAERSLNKLKHPRQYTWPFEQPLIYLIEINLINFRQKYITIESIFIFLIIL
jgi:hypothetical protein